MHDVQAQYKNTNWNMPDVQGKLCRTKQAVVLGTANCMTGSTKLPHRAVATAAGVSQTTKWLQFCLF
jgi:hypothetical protein